MKRAFANRVLMLLGAVLPLLCQAQELRLVVRSGSAVERQQVVAIDAAQVRSRLGLSDGEPLVVRDAFGEAVDCQLTYDGLLLADVAVRPRSQAVLTVARGHAPRPRQWVAGAEYPYRKNDIAWENDRVGFRVYGPQFQRDGDVGNGIDVWVKPTSELVLPRLYEDQCFRGISFHRDHGLGMDCYGVGPSLGCGAPALLAGDSLVMAYCYQTYEILDNGPLRFTLRLHFAPADKGTGRPVSEHRLITMDKGSHFCRMTVWYDGLDRPADVAAGLVLHSGDGVETGDGWMIYADPTQDPDRHQSEIYVAALFPQGEADILARHKPVAGAGIWGHLLGVRRSLTDGEPFTYYFGAAWSKADIKNLGQWRRCVDDELEALRQPLTVTIE